MLYHWCPRVAWPPTGGAYVPAGYAADGFVHCSYLDQVTATATALDRGRADLVLLAIDEADLPVVVEDCYEIGEPYPHVYSAIPPGAVAAAVDFPCLADGTFALPGGLLAEAIDPPFDLPGHPQASTPEVGRMLARLAGAAPAGMVGEIGTGGGHGAAWLASGLRPGQHLVTVDVEPAPPAVATLDPVEAITADWTAILARGPFGLLFVDAAPAKTRADVLVPALNPGGVVVLDDLTPRHLLDPATLAADPVRHAWHGHPGVAAVERQVGAGEAALVARRPR